VAVLSRAINMSTGVPTPALWGTVHYMPVGLQCVAPQTAELLLVLQQ
jgi:hypothetical protein